MKVVLMSIRPKWCEMIFSGEKTIEVRKTAPKLDPPFKVYVYCTKERMTRVPSMYAYLHKNEPRACAEYGTIEKWGEIGDVIVNPHLASKHLSYGMHGKVVGEFVCEGVRAYIPFGLRGFELPLKWLEQMCLSKEQLDKYGGLKTLYGWHIAEAKLYDEPKELSEFRTPETRFYEIKRINGYLVFGDGYRGGKVIIRPPQSWCYVEEVEK